MVIVIMAITKSKRISIIKEKIIDNDDDDDDDNNNLK